LDLPVQPTLQACLRGASRPLYETVLSPRRAITQSPISVAVVTYSSVKHKTNFTFSLLPVFPGGPDSSVGIATRYGLDGPGIECR
jgi:hypothetical protein